MKSLNYFINIVFFITLFSCNNNETNDNDHTRYGNKPIVKQSLAFDKDNITEAISENSSVYTRRYSSKQNIGSIGVSYYRQNDNPEDNIFLLDLDTEISASKNVWLIYDLKGVSDASGVSKSINDAPAIGGYFVNKNTNWKEVKERIDPSLLHKGVNRILFSIPYDADYSYSVRNVRIEVCKTIAESDCPLIFSNDHFIAYDDKVYLSGYAIDDVSSICLDGQKINIYGNSFEGIVHIKKEKQQYLSVRLLSGQEFEIPLRQIKYEKDAEIIHPFKGEIIEAKALFAKGKSLSIGVDGGELSVKQDGLIKTNFVCKFSERY